MGEVRITDEMVEAARAKGRELAGNQPGALVEAMAEIAEQGARAALSAALSGMAEPVKVKPLEWRHYPDAFPPMWVAGGAFGHYSIEESSGTDSPTYDVFQPTKGRIANVDGLPEAKAAAQADYEARIRSALLPDVSGMAEPVAWRWKHPSEPAWKFSLNHPGWDSTSPYIVEPLYPTPGEATPPASGLREENRWQPIETAPRDGTVVDLLMRDGVRCTDEWWIEDEGEAFWSCGLLDDQFSHWMPLPAPPALQTEGK